mmetsp:Transcript_6208/g.18805  ORF Transcript_6208/g.18805 Transcript_6208/m.18805 type:complete len:309 (+) Transcript_6208:28-954(+)
MARAYLGVDDALRECFVGCQEDGSVRWVAAKIEGEKVCLVTTSKVSGSVEEDFEGIREVIASDEPMFVLFATETEQPRSWMLLAWVPDAAAPRLKMLYSSSREDLKSGLGSGYFTRKDYCANHADDVAWSQVTAVSSAPLTEAEVLLAEEKKMEKDVSLKSSGMATLPFSLSRRLEALLAEDHAILAITLDGETLDGTPCDDLPDDAAGPKFVLLRKSTLVYFCPDHASLKDKMTYATAKPTLLELLGASGLKIAKSVEIRADLADEVAALDRPETDQRTITHQPNSKPRRPGRASVRSRVKKWSPDG